MNRPAAKGKTTPRRAPCLAQRASGPTRSYRQTRVRASRVLNAARILALIELTQRLHQAYDKQAADQLLPQNPTQKPMDTTQTEKMLTEDCLGSLGKSMAPGLAQADRILTVANRTGVDPTLLAVTWRFESGFSFQPVNGLMEPYNSSLVSP